MTDHQRHPGQQPAHIAGGAMVHKALAGYIQLPNGRWLTFAQFTAQASSLAAASDLADRAQAAMAEIATAAYQTLGRSPR